MSINEHPLDQFWVLTDKQADGLVAFISVARHRTHHRADGSNIIAISPAFKNAEDTKSHIKAMIADLSDALASVDALFKKVT